MQERKAALGLPTKHEGRRTLLLWLASIPLAPLAAACITEQAPRVEPIFSSSIPVSDYRTQLVGLLEGSKPREVAIMPETYNYGAKGYIEPDQSLLYNSGNIYDTREAKLVVLTPEKYSTYNYAQPPKADLVSDDGKLLDIKSFRVSSAKNKLPKNLFADRYAENTVYAIDFMTSSPQEIARRVAAQGLTFYIQKVNRVEALYFQAQKAK